MNVDDIDIKIERWVDTQAQREQWIKKQIANYSPKPKDKERGT